MNNNKKVKICEFTVRATGILFWYNILIMVFNSEISRYRITMIILALIIGLIGLKAKEYFVSKS